VVGVQVREDDVRYVPGRVTRFVEMVEKIRIPPQLVAADQYLRELWSESGVDEHEVIARLDEDGMHGSLDAGLPGAAEEVASVRNEYAVVQDLDPHPCNVEVCPSSQVVEPSSGRESE
jgi:hypothetical protein